VLCAHACHESIVFAQSQAQKIVMEEQTRKEIDEMADTNEAKKKRAPLKVIKQVSGGAGVGQRGISLDINAGLCCRSSSNLRCVAGHHAAHDALRNAGGAGIPDEPLPRCLWRRLPRPYRGMCHCTFINHGYHIKRARGRSLAITHIACRRLRTATRAGRQSRFWTLGRARE
jgi:hypothetical protein